MEELEDLARALGADAGHLAEVGDRGPLDLLQGPEMHEQRALARGADAGNLLQAGLADVLLAQFAVRADHEAMRLVAHPLDEIQHGVARLELHWRPIHLRRVVGMSRAIVSYLAGKRNSKNTDHLHSRYSQQTGENASA